jgi:GT2 family glycosyltransferase
VNIAQPKKIVLLGFLSHFPVAGVAWQTIHYLVGFQRLGYDVYYVEAHGCTPSKLMQAEQDDGALRAAGYIKEIMYRFGLDGRWAYDAVYESRCFGMTETQLLDLYRSAAVIINLHGSHLPKPEWSAGNRLVYLGTDPVDIEIDLAEQKQEAIDYLAPHAAFFTYGENLGRPDCRVPVPEQFRFHPTRQPVVMDFWASDGAGDAATFTTIGNWRQPWREVRFKGELYRWSKHFEFLKFIDLPTRTPQPFELALSSCDEADHKLLRSKGWRVRQAMEFSSDPDAYRSYICGSRGEFTVAKDQNVRLRSGWFSDRAVTYLAAGRPVITQETGFSNILPTGEGLFAFSTMEEILCAVDAINADYERHRRAARNIAREYLSHEVVLTRMLRDLGLQSGPGSSLRRQGELAPESSDGVGFAVRPEHCSRIPDLPSGLAPQEPTGRALPETLVITPVSRWPTQLPEQTLRAALDLGIPWASISRTGRSTPASIIMVTHNGLPYTKMCLTTLLEVGWAPGDELLIVDNASTDSTPTYLREVARRNAFVQLTLNEENRGFARANNQGLRQAKGNLLILLNNDTLVLEGWIDTLARRLEDQRVGMVGPVTNRTCNGAQIDAPYRSYAELKGFASQYVANHGGQAIELNMLAMFCVALRREVFEEVGPLDERFEIGMFEDDDYALRVHQAGYRLLCVEDVFVHHFGQASLGHLCANGDYNLIFESNRRKFEDKWGVTWQPHGRRITAQYQQLRQRIRSSVMSQLPVEAKILVVSKGDEELLKLEGRKGWHFPQSEDGRYANIYPANSAEAIAQLEALRAKGAEYLLIPKPAFWWLDYYAEFKRHLERHYHTMVQDEETCLIYASGGTHG